MGIISSIDFIWFEKAPTAEEAYRKANLRVELAGILQDFKGPWNRTMQEKATAAAKAYGDLRNTGKRRRPECWAFGCGKTKDGQTMWALFGWSA